MSQLKVAYPSDTPFFLSPSALWLGKCCLELLYFIHLSVTFQNNLLATLRGNW